MYAFLSPTMRLFQGSSVRCITYCFLYSDQSAPAMYCFTAICIAVFSSLHVFAVPCEGLILQFALLFSICCMSLQFLAMALSSLRHVVFSQYCPFIRFSTWDTGICFSLLCCAAARHTHRRACSQNTMSLPYVFTSRVSTHDKHTIFVTATTLHSMGGFVPLHGGSSLRSFAWAVSPVTVTAPG